MTFGQVEQFENHEKPDTKWLLLGFTNDMNWHLSQVVGTIGQSPPDPTLVGGILMKNRVAVISPRPPFYQQIGVDAIPQKSQPNLFFVQISADISMKNSIFVSLFTKIIHQSASDLGKLRLDPGDVFPMGPSPKPDPASPTRSQAFICWLSLSNSEALHGKIWPLR